MELDTNLNEDGVPMDEKDVEHIWLDFANKAGFFGVHIENIGSSMPDTMIIWKGIVLFQEIKVQRGNLIYLQQYQWANFARMRHSCHSWQLNIVAWKNGVFKLFNMEQLKSIPCDSAGKGKVKFNIELLTPMITVSNDYEYAIYVEWLRGKIWKKKT